MSMISSTQHNNQLACLTWFLTDDSWIFDSGALNHISGHKSLFSKLSSPSMFPLVTLTNGSHTEVKGIGETHPVPFISLSSVLFIPNCPYNLISVS